MSLLIVHPSAETRQQRMGQVLGCRAVSSVCTAIHSSENLGTACTAHQNGHVSLQVKESQKKFIEPDTK